MAQMIAEPNLVCLSGHDASFQSGGQFAIITTQTGSTGAVPVTTTQFQEFGVRLDFRPYVMDHERIRLTVAPQLTNIDPTLGVNNGGVITPGLNTNIFHSTLEMRQGQTMVMAGLMQLTRNGTTNRVMGLGDIPIIGNLLFATNTQDRQETELAVAVTPYLVEPMNSDQVPGSLAGDVNEPNDWEMVFFNRLESRVGRDFRSTTEWDNVFDLPRVIKLEKRHVHGQCGFAD